MFIELNATQGNLLTGLPETGMGFQLVNVTLKDQRVYNHLVCLSGYMLQIPLEANFTSDDIESIDMDPNAIPGEEVNGH
jgi:hypothetical protein